VSDDDLDMEEILPADEDDDSVESDDDCIEDENAVTGDSEAVQTADQPKAAPSAPPGPSGM